MPWADDAAPAAVSSRGRDHAMVSPFSYSVDISQYDEPEDDDAYYGRSRLAFVDDDSAATHLQAAFRAHTGRRWLRSWRRAATKIQAMWRLTKEEEQKRADVASGRAGLLALGRSIGVDTERELPLLLVAEQLAAARLPDGWVEYLDDDGERFYHHEASETSTFDHPQAPKYKQRVVEARRRMEASDSWKAEQRRLAAVEEAKEVARQAELAAIREGVRRKYAEYARRQAEAEAEVRRIAAMEAAAATRIQAVWRARLPRRETHKRLEHKRDGDRLREVGAARRAAATARAERLSELMAAEEKARSAARLLNAQKKHSVRAQALWRGRACRRELAAQQAGAVAVQARWRGRRCRAEAAEAKHAATSMQATMRGRWARRDLAAKLEAEANQAALVVQSRFRGWQARGESAKRLAVIIRLQGIWRGKVWRREMAELGHVAAKLQAHWRGHAVRVRAAFEQRAALKVQAKWRGDRVRFRQRRKTRAAVRMQTAWRGRCGRVRGRREAHAAMQVKRIYSKYDSSGALGVLGQKELQRISRDAHALGGRCVRENYHFLAPFSDGEKHTMSFTKTGSGSAYMQC